MRREFGGIVVSIFSLLAEACGTTTAPSTSTGNTGIAVVMTPTSATVPAFSVGPDIRTTIPCGIGSIYWLEYYIRDDGARLTPHPLHGPEKTGECGYDPKVAANSYGTAIVNAPVKMYPGDEDGLYEFGRGHTVAVWYVVARDQGAVDRLLVQGAQPNPTNEFNARIGTLTIPNDTPIVWGYVYDAASTSCCPRGFTVEIMAPPGSTSQSGTSGFNAFAFRKVPPGNVTIRATHPDYNPVERLETVIADDLYVGRLLATRR